MEDELEGVDEKVLEWLDALEKQFKSKLNDADLANWARQNVPELIQTIREEYA